MTSIVVGKDRISLLESERYVSGTKNVYLIHVTFSEDWQDLDKQLVFKTDTLEQAVELRTCSEQFAIPWEVLAKPSNRLQVGAYGYECGDLILNTRWLSLGRVAKGVTDTVCSCGCPTIPVKPSPDTYQSLRLLIDRKADRLTYEDDMFMLWAGDELLTSFEAPVILPKGGTVDQVLAKASNKEGEYYWRTINSREIGSASFKVPLGVIQVWSGSIEDIPESYSLCDGQNGTPDLREVFIMGASEDIAPGTEGVVTSNGIQTLSLTPDDPVPEPEPEPETGVKYYALAFIQKTSYTEDDLKEPMSAYDVAVEEGFEGGPEEWLASLKGKPGVAGKDGESAYDIAKAQGFKGTPEQFAEQLYAATVNVVTNRVVTSRSTLGVKKTGTYLFDNVVIDPVGSLARVSVNKVTFYNSIVFVDLRSTKRITLTNVANTRWICELDEEGNIVSVDEQSLNLQINNIIDSLGGIGGGSGSESGGIGGTGTPGAPGKSAYEIAVDNGFEGSELEWLESLRGETGSDGAVGKSAYQIAVDHGFRGTEDDWLASFGQNGRSAYEIALDSGYVGSETDWLKTLVGPQGVPGFAGADGKDGKDGTDGLSAYQIAKDQGFEGTEAEWLESLKGADGKTGAQGESGKSAYEIAVDNGYSGTEEEWLASLVGKSVQSIPDYQEDETLAGRWTDDRPIYRKVIQTTVGEIGTSKTIASLPNVTPIKSITGLIDSIGSTAAMNEVWSIPGSYQNYNYGLSYDPDSGNIKIWSNDDSTANRKVTIMIEYVKPNDDILQDSDLIVDSSGSTGGTNDHTQLINRSVANQHPISAINGLTEIIKVTPTEAITNDQLNALFES